VADAIDPDLVHKGLGLLAEEMVPHTPTPNPPAGGAR
jgi:hypothetical protein